jgi:hypothetical protein
MSKPIPERLLPHTVKIQIPVSFDRDRNPTYGDEQTLTHVRVTPVKQTYQGPQGDAKDDKLTLFIDAVNTSPAGYVPVELSIVTWEKSTYTIRSVTPCYTTGTEVHHYEAALV